MPDFKVKFDMTDYLDICSKEQTRSYLEHDEILNYRSYEKGNIEECVWKQHVATPREISSPEFRRREVIRIIKTGVMAAIKDEIVWLPPNYYYALQYGRVGDQPLEFRLKRLKHVYHKIRARKNPGCKGTFTVKNRGDGETTMAIHDALHECIDGIMSVGSIGIQSKTRADAKNPCWLTAQTTWLNMDQWIKDELYADFISGENIAEKLKFQRQKTAEEEARNIVMEYFPSVFNAMDGRHNMRRCILDEVLKWIECNFYDTLTNYSKFIMPGMERRGIFDIFSSPADKDCQSYRDGYELWKISNPDEIDPETGTTKSRIHRYYSNPLEGIQGSYDMWGDADPEKIYAYIMKMRESVPKDKQLEEIRGFPLTEEEMWGSIEGTSQWSNTKGIKERKIYLIGRRFKDEKTKEPTVVYGNLEWQDGAVDTDVVFRQADVEKFDIQKARFCFSHLPQNKEPLKDARVPPKIIENCMGLDPFDYRYYTKDPSRQSEGAMVNRKFLDLFETGVNKCPTMIYCCRPQHQDTFFEDAIKAIVFNRAMCNYENRSDKFANYAEDRGYFDWLLPEIGAAAGSTRKGDSPTGKGKFLAEGMALLDAATNLPLKAGDPYHLDNYWFIELIGDYLKFNQKNTQMAHLTMADMQALIGCVKLMHKKVRQPSEVNDAVLSYLLD